jgi:hypothetical protein
MQTVLHYPRSALIGEIETIATPDVTDQVVDGTESIKRATELAAE